MIAISKEEKDLAKQNKKVLKDNSLKEGLPNINKFIYDLDKDRGNAWSAQSYTKDGNGNKIIIVSKNGQSDNTAEDIKNEVENKYQNLKGEITENGNNVWFYLQESSLKEGYEAFKIGEIEGVFNPSTGEAMYSIPSKNVTDKKINLEKIQSVETPYDTDTIIKDYIEKNYGTISTVSDEPAEDTNPEPIEKSDDIETAEDDVEVNIDDNEELEEDVQAETGSASFYKIRQRENISIDSLLDKASNGANSQESEYIVVKDLDLSDEEMNNLLSNLSKPQTFLQGTAKSGRSCTGFYTGKRVYRK